MDVGMGPSMGVVTDRPSGHTGVLGQGINRNKGDLDVGAGPGMGVVIQAPGAAWGQLSDQVRRKQESVNSCSQLSRGSFRGSHMIASSSSRSDKLRGV
jgi:hypothetical protein